MVKLNCGNLLTPHRVYSEFFFNLNPSLHAVVHKGRKARRTSWILRVTTLGFIYTLDVLLSKLSLSVSESSNDKVLTCRSLLIAYLIVLTDTLS